LFYYIKHAGESSGLLAFANNHGGTSLPNAYWGL